MTTKARTKGESLAARRQSRAHEQPDSPADIEEAPTPERRRHKGMKRVSFSVIAGGGRGTRKVWIDTAATGLMAAHEDGKLSEAQWNAALRYERLHRQAREMGGSRDSLDMTPRGQSEQTESQADRIVSARDELRLVNALLPLMHRLTLHDVAIYSFATGPREMARQRWRTIVEALDICAEFWRFS